eukprot:gnl/TRDRNA2_/TRDRNA2_90111_c0_seq1.p1 gnl/TRDRNA2_/TRDRNA2_90111_c0~~gnl/TRDRNA2_/TRDRNA2_90111_c0_seq1.p1  ORF type:complete len:186 (-),score=42.73 gnl/TRDRNA2_/TRDRNA2_90111_c0_seq1:483-1040(-)
MAFMFSLEGLWNMILDETRRISPTLHRLLPNYQRLMSLDDAGGERLCRLVESFFNILSIRDGSVAQNPAPPAAVAENPTPPAANQIHDHTCLRQVGGDVSPEDMSEPDEDEEFENAVEVSKATGSGIESTAESTEHATFEDLLHMNDRELEKLQAQFREEAKEHLPAEHVDDRRALDEDRIQVSV